MVANFNIKITERHPYNELHPVPDDTETLIIGTAPPPRFSNPALGGIRDGDAEFYYGSEDNCLWWDIFDAINQKLTGKKLFTDKDWEQCHCLGTMRQFLRSHKIWMRDVLQAYKRDDPCSPSDNQIRDIEFADFRGQFRAAPSIRKIAFTSEKAAEWTLEAFEEQGLVTPEKRRDTTEKLKTWRGADAPGKYQQSCFEASPTGTGIEFFILPTPTGRSRAGLKIVDKVDIYRCVLFPGQRDQSALQ
ncbi:uracil-DNA glycosylase family protein [Bradyrhizobium diazoefficiens]